MPRFIFVIGGVLSGLGKGIVTASIAKILQSCGYSVTAIKIDPYVNVDAGTMRPTEHGEVWVTEDGGEIDQDLGNYERFLNKNIPKKNNITTGKVFLSVIKKERALKYNGKDVELIPDVVNEIKKMIYNGAEDNEFVLVEIGGTTGDIENLPFLHAAREIGREYPAIYILVTYLPFLRNVGELKTKPTQHAAAQLREVGIFPDFIITRSETGIDEPRREKIAKHCFVNKSAIIDDPDISNIYSIPLLFTKQKFGEKIQEKFGLEPKKANLENWKRLVENLENTDKIVKIGLVGKYIELGKAEHGDVYISVLQAIKHAGAHLGVKPIIEQIQSTKLEEDPESLKELRKFDGIIVPGGFGASGVEGKIKAIKFCRENKIPFLGLCYGMQLAVIEFARNVCGLKGANTTEVDENTKYPVIDIMPEQKKLVSEGKYGATMRLGGWPAILKEGSKVRKVYGKEKIVERHRHRYEVNPEYVNALEENGLTFSGKSPDGKLMEFLELKNHPFFIATQAHPEFKSRFENPSPLFVAFIKATMENQPVQKNIKYYEK